MYFDQARKRRVALRIMDRRVQIQLYESSQRSHSHYKVGVEGELLNSKEQFLLICLRIAAVDHIRTVEHGT
jgi:hypothetical protein